MLSASWVLIVSLSLRLAAAATQSCLFDEGNALAGSCDQGTSARVAGSEAGPVAAAAAAPAAAAPAAGNTDTKHGAAAEPTMRAFGPIVRQPAAAGRHTGTCILMHGLGDTADGWAPVGPSLNLPHIKFIYPTAPTRPITVNMGMKMPGCGGVPCGAVLRVCDGSSASCWACPSSLRNRC